MQFIRSLIRKMNRSGHTLVNVLLVIVISGSLLAIALMTPKDDKTNERREMAIRDLSTSFGFLQEDSVTRRISHTVSIDPAAGTITANDNDGPRKAWLFYLRPWVR